jgi:hypothetical protein
VQGITAMNVLPVRYLDYLPLVAVFLATVLLLLVFHEIGFRIGRRWQVSGKAQSSQTGAIMAAALALLAFMLAFTFGSAASRFDARKQAVLREANAIGTTWLRSQMLPSAYQAQIEPLLLRYVEVRIEGAQAESLDEFKQALVESTALHDKLWAHAVALGKEDPRSIVLGLFINSLNEVIDLHTTRITVARQRMPGGVWLTLYFIAFASTMMVGVNAGQSGGRSLFMTALLASALSAVMVLIIDVDRPSQTLFSVSQQALVDLRNSMKERGP